MLFASEMVYPQSEPENAIQKHQLASNIQKPVNKRQEHHNWVRKLEENAQLFHEFGSDQSTKCKKQIVNAFLSLLTRSMLQKHHAIFPRPFCSFWTFLLRYWFDYTANWFPGDSTSFCSAEPRVCIFFLFTVKSVYAENASLELCHFDSSGCSVRVAGAIALCQFFSFTLLFREHSRALHSHGRYCDVWASCFFSFFSVFDSFVSQVACFCVFVFSASVL